MSVALEAETGQPTKYGQSSTGEKKRIFPFCLGCISVLPGFRGMYLRFAPARLTKPREHRRLALTRCLQKSFDIKRQAFPPSTANPFHRNLCDSLENRIFVLTASCEGVH